MTVGEPGADGRAVAGAGRRAGPGEVAAAPRRRGDARVVSTVSIVATLLTGLGLVAAGLANLPTVARVLAIGAVGARVRRGAAGAARADLAVIRDLNRENLAEVEDWYLQRFAAPGPAGAVGDRSCWSPRPPARAPPRW